MNVIILVLSMVAAAASYKLVPYPPPGCEDCRSDPKRCIYEPVECVTTPCPQYRCISTLPKDGKCPIMIAQHFDECVYDDQCFGKMKCCNGKCVTPEITERPGSCPYYPLSICLPTEDRRDECSVDTDCKAPMKCCGYCGKECAMPMPKPGVCPVSRRPCILVKKEECTNDYECKGHDKCCKDECGILVCVGQFQ